MMIQKMISGLMGLVMALFIPLAGPLDVGPQEKAPVRDEIATNYELIVVDGSPEGVAAAVSAARNGVKTLLLCQDEALGGLYTLGELNFLDEPQARNGQVLVKGIYQEFSEAVGGSGFDVDVAKDVLYTMATNEKKLTVRMESEFVAPIMDGNAISGVQMKEDGKTVAYTAPLVIDATPDGDVSAASGAPYTYAGEDIGEREREMGVTLVFRVSGVDWDAVKAHVGEGGDAEAGANDRLAWGYSEEGFAYEPKDENTRLRGFNLARQENGDVLINALIIFGVDPLDEDSYADGIARGQEELGGVLKYIRKTCAGFEDAELVNTAEQLYVRESRHVECDYMLTIDDCLENRAQPDAICTTSYPVDVQATKTQTYGTVIGYPDQYQIGLRSLVPKDVEGLMIVGRSAGYRSLAAGSARIVPTGMACGEAAGVAAKVATERGLTPRGVCADSDATIEVQTLLAAQGANLDHTQTVDEVTSHWAYSGLKVMRSLGYADGGYSNDYRLDETVKGQRFANVTNMVIKKSGLEAKPAVSVSEDATNLEMLNALATKLAELEKVDAPTDARAFLSERGILDDELASHWAEDEAITDIGSVYMLGAKTYTYLLTLEGAQTLVGVDSL